MKSFGDGNGWVPGVSGASMYFANRWVPICKNNDALEDATLWTLGEFAWLSSEGPGRRPGTGRHLKVIWKASGWLLGDM